MPLEKSLEQKLIQRLYKPSMPIDKKFPLAERAEITIDTDQKILVYVWGITTNPVNEIYYSKTLGADGNLEGMLPNSRGRPLAWVNDYRIID